MPVHIPSWPPEFFTSGPMIISETQTHIVVAVEVSKATLTRHRRFLDQQAGGGGG